MPDPTQIGFSLVGLSIAALDVTAGTYGTPVALEYGQSLSFEPQHDTDPLKAFGMLVERLSVLTHITGSLSQGLIDYPAYAVMIGSTQTSTGATPNIEKTLDVQAGGGGMPYFGLIGKLATLQNGDLHIGFPKCQLDKVPGFTIEQNKFILPTTSLAMLTPNATIRKIFRYRTHETAVAVAADFDTFFTGFFA